MSDGNKNDKPPRPAIRILKDGDPSYPAWPPYDPEKESKRHLDELERKLNDLKAAKGSPEEIAKLEKEYQEMAAFHHWAYHS